MVISLHQRAIPLLKITNNSPAQGSKLGYTKMKMKMIQWPLVNAENELHLPTEWRADDCLRFNTDGRIENNGGPVGHHEITDEQIEMLPESDQNFVREFLGGNYTIDNH